MPQRDMENDEISTGNVPRAEAIDWASIVALRCKWERTRVIELANCKFAIDEDTG